MTVAHLRAISVSREIGQLGQKCRDIALEKPCTGKFYPKKKYENNLNIMNMGS